MKKQKKKLFFSDCIRYRVLSNEDGTIMVLDEDTNQPIKDAGLMIYMCGGVDAVKTACKGGFFYRKAFVRLEMGYREERKKNERMKGGNG